MIERYSRPEMYSIWSEENKFKVWLEIEILALEAMEKLGEVPEGVPALVREKACFDIARIDEIEKEVKHDVIAFLTSVGESLGSEACYVHRGMTSSDLLDTAFAVRLKQSGELILKDFDKLLIAVKERALEHKNTPCMGRSHGIHAEATTFGLKMAGWYTELCRQRVRFEEAWKGIQVGTISGAVGTYAGISPEVEKYVTAKLGLEGEKVATQVIPRDRHAAFFVSLAQIGGSIERFAIEVRHLQRTEVREVEELFSKGQKGSSAMPHKKNPILCENLTGLARLLRSYSLSAMENVALWHERDISHSSVERVIAPDACILADFMLSRFTSVAERMVVYPERMMSNIQMTRGLIFSASTLTALTGKGMSREDAYAVIQEHSMATWKSEPGLKERLITDSRVSEVLSQDEVEEIFRIDSHLKNVDYIFERVFG